MRQYISPLYTHSHMHTHAYTYIHIHKHAHLHIFYPNRFVSLKMADFALGIKKRTYANACVCIYMYVHVCVWMCGCVYKGDMYCLMQKIEYM